MAIVGGVVLVLLFGVLGFMVRDGQGDLFRRMGSLLYDFCNVRGYKLTNSRSVRSDLEHLHPGQSKEALRKNYYVEKIRLVLLILLVGAVLGILLQVKYWAEGGGQSIEALQRGETGQGEREVILEAVVGRDREKIVIEVSERMLTDRELEILFKECAGGLDRWIEENKDASGKISQELQLPESLDGYPFEILWRENVEGELKAYLYYGEEMYCHTLFVERNRMSDGEASMEERLCQEIEKQNIETQYDEMLTLPAELDGGNIVWREVTENYSGLLMIAAAVVAIGVFFLKDRDLHDELLNRKRNMRMSYPVILNKFVLYMGAGLTVRGSFLKIASDYQGREEGMEAYEEMLISCNELNAGISESQVYESFGSRTGLQEYARFATMLSQNLKKGNAALLTRLREESEKAQLENLQYRKKLGEEAQTKLLIPMVMMMAIVMLLVMIPAFSSF